jgi:hypothetical protein
MSLTITRLTRFSYLKDPLFLACLVVYFVNRWVLKFYWTSGFLHTHLNDLLCIPFWTPIMLWLQKRLGFREYDGPPLLREIVLPLFVWSWMFEIYLPRTALFNGRAISDHWDIVYYSLGALLAAMFWRLWYAHASYVKGRKPSTEPAS